MPPYLITAPPPALYAASMLSVESPGTFLTSSAKVQSYAACAAMASAGLRTSLTPSPSPSLPCWAQVPGMNWAIPRAPTGDVAPELKWLSV